MTDPSILKNEQYNRKNSLLKYKNKFELALLNEINQFGVFFHYINQCLKNQSFKIYPKFRNNFSRNFFFYK